ncbi:MAG: 1,4-dihydroxy-6-naphthoate synthase [Saprospiraceae bacterium]|nr:1,4-dihydroxy-6-naphthoate synthase [Candidatus Brachybacter algidus]
MTLSFAISPCPNDTFIYGAIANQLIESPHEFEFSYHDIETLNKMAQTGKTDLIKMSFYNYFHVKDNYRLLPCGGALGRGVGPLLITKNINEFQGHNSIRIAIPGKNTTANFLLNFYNPEYTELIEFPFDKIEQAVLNGDVEAGVIIHENRFTYADKGLQLLVDLGSHWESVTSSPIPLGCLAVRQDIADEIEEDIIKLVRQSILFAQNHYSAIKNYVADHAQEMDPKVAQAHIELYVNDFSYDMGSEGWKAVDAMELHLKTNQLIN